MRSNVRWGILPAAVRVLVAAAVPVRALAAVLVIPDPALVVARVILVQVQVPAGDGLVPAQVRVLAVALAAAVARVILVQVQVPAGDGLVPALAQDLDLVAVQVAARDQAVVAVQVGRRPLREWVVAPVQGVVLVAVRSLARQGHVRTEGLVFRPVSYRMDRGGLLTEAFFHFQPSVFLVQCCVFWRLS